MMFGAGLWVGERYIGRNNLKILVLSEHLSDESEIRLNLALLRSIRTKSETEIIPVIEKIVSEKMKAMESLSNHGAEFAQYSSVAEEEISRYNAEFGVNLYVPKDTINVSD